MKELMEIKLKPTYNIIIKDEMKYKNTASHYILT